MLSNLWNKFWRDKNGKVVIWQNPNAALYAWAVLTFLSLLFSRGHIADALSLGGTVALIIWSLLEVFRGVNYFRRTLGIVILYFAIMTLLRSI